MKEKEGQLAAEAAELLRKAQEVDDEEDRRYGKDERGDELPEELAFRESRLRKIREAKAALEAEAQAEAEQAEVEGKKHPGTPDDKAQRNFTDPDSCIMPGSGGTSSSPTTARQWWTAPTRSLWRPGPPTSPRDKQQAVSMIEEAIGNVGTVPREVPPTPGTTRPRRWMSYTT